MNVDFTFTALLDLLAFVQGTLLGILLMFKKREHVGYFFLGVFLFTYSSELLVSVFSDSGVFSQKPNLLYLPITYYLTFMPALYLYVQSLRKQLQWKKYAWLFIPGLLEVTFFTYLFFQSTDVKQQQLQSGWTSALYKYYVDFAMVYTLVYIGAIYYEIKRYREQAMDYYADTQGKLLIWVQWTCAFIAIVNLVLLSSNFIPSTLFLQYVYPVISALNVVLIFWIALSGFRQENIPAPAENAPNNEEQENDLPYGKEHDTLLKADTDKSFQDFEHITNMLRTEKHFTQSDLTLSSLASQLQISQRHLSELINQKAGVNFNQYINGMRVEEAKKLLVDSKYSHLSIMGIGYEVGFNSKTSFYTTFKKMTHQTPAEYQKTANKKLV